MIRGSSVNTKIPVFIAPEPNMGRVAGGRTHPGNSTLKKYLDRYPFSIYIDVFQGHPGASRPFLSHLRPRSQSPENRASSASSHASIQSEFCANSLQPAWIQ